LSKAKLAKIIGQPWLLLSAGIVLGALLIMGIRFATYHVDDVHYHANFAVYINGQPEKFSDPQYYSEIEMCTASKEIIPSQRAHMHDNINNVVHVEDHSVTWGQFFTNLGWYLGPDFIQTANGTLYRENGADKLNLMIHGQDYSGLGSFANRVIKDEDKLLISFGDASQSQLQQEYKAIPATAHKYDIEKDPASCGGHVGPTMRERMNHMF